MNNNVNVNISETITVTDYKGDTTSLTTYCLPSTPFKFSIAGLDEVSTATRVTWFFGDGTTSDAISPEHYYLKPGRYTVSFVLFDQTDRGEIASLPVTVTVEDIVKDSVTVETTQQDNTIQALAGELSNAIRVTQTLPIHVFDEFKFGGLTPQVITKENSPIGFLPKSLKPQTTVTEQEVVFTDPVLPDPVRQFNELQVDYKVLSSQTEQYHYLVPGKYNHLEASHTLIKREYISQLDSDEFTPISKINIQPRWIYAYLDKTGDNNKVRIESSNIDVSIDEAIEYSKSINGDVVGLSGAQILYYRDDFPTDGFSIRFARRPKNLRLNPYYITLSGAIANNTEPESLSITSNGIDGDGGVATNFDVDKNKFANSRIHFVLKLKDISGFNIKYTPELVLNDTVFITLSSQYSNIQYKVHSLQDTLSSFQGGGYFRGYLEIGNSSSEPLSGISIIATVSSLSTVNGIEIINPLSAITSSSAKFNIYPSNYFKLFKEGEDFDGEGMYKSLRFSESLLDKEVFFGDFLGAIFGDKESDPDALSKKIYERIHNFVDNTSNIDTAEIARIISMNDMIKSRSNIFDNSLISFPSKLQRIINLLSISPDKLFGYRNKFVQNFNDYNITTKEEYGINLGVKIDPVTYIINPGTDIVAYEKFSNKYFLLNTYQPLSACIPGVTPPLEAIELYGDQYVQPDGLSRYLQPDGISLYSSVLQLNGDEYMLSSYNATWGWPLVESTDGAPLSAYYNFFTFNDLFANNVVGTVLNTDLTTIDFDTSYNELTDRQGIYENLILDTLYSSLSLINNNIEYV